MSFFDELVCAMCCASRPNTKERKGGEPAFHQNFAALSEEEDGRNTYANNYYQGEENSLRNRMSRATAVFSFYGRGTQAARDDRGERGREQAFLEDVRKIAQQLECTCQKYPKCGGVIKSGWGVKERYFVVQPEPEDGDAGGGSRDADATSRELRRWYRGCLAYWEDRQAFLTSVEERGRVDLMKIAKVSWHKEEPHCVKVKHKYQGKFYELVLRFATKSDAERWNHNLWDIIRRLREWYGTEN